MKVSTIMILIGASFNLVGLLMLEISLALIGVGFMYVVAGILIFKKEKEKE